MKTNEAPEKIWVHELSAKELNVPFKEYHVEYTRTDAFIEKATEWLKKNVTYTHPRKGTEECVVNLNAFIEAMKGE